MPDEVIVADNPVTPAPTTDAPPAAAPAVATPPVDARPAPATPAPTTLGGDVDKPAGENDPPAEATWRDDWRERIAGKDEKQLSRLKRFASPENLFKSYQELERKMQSGALKAGLPEDASPEEVAAFRKSNGLPETPEGYEFSVPPEIELTAEDKAQMDRFKGVFHQNNVAPALAKSLTEAFFADRLEAEVAMRDAAQEKTINYRSEMRAELGKDYVQHTTLAKSWLDGMVGEEGRTKITDTILADGTRLGDNPDFVRLVVQGALANAPEGKLIEAEFGGAGKSIEEQYNEAMGLMHTDMATFNSKAHQDKLFRLAEIKASRKPAA